MKCLHCEYPLRLELERHFDEKSWESLWWCEMCGALTAISMKDKKYDKAYVPRVHVIQM